MHQCGIEGCSHAFERGGRASPDDPKLARCPMHYHRERRKSAIALEPGPRVAGVRREVYLPPEVDEFLQRIAARAGRTPADWMRACVIEGLDAAMKTGARSTAAARRKGNAR